MEQKEPKNNGSPTDKVMSGSQAAQVGSSKATDNLAEDAVDAMTNLSRSVRTLKACLVTQDGDMKQLFQKTTALECIEGKRRSPVVKEAIEDLLAVVGVIRERRDSVIRAFNSMQNNTSALEAEVRRGLPAANSTGACKSSATYTSVSTQTSTGSEFFTRAKKSNAGTQTANTATPDVGIKKISTAERATDTPCW